MLRRHHLVVLALGLAGSPLAAQRAAPPLALRPADWAAPAAVTPDAPAGFDAPSATEATRVRLQSARSERRIRPSFTLVTSLLGMVAGGAAGGTVMSRQCHENCGVKAFYGALGGSSLGFTLGFTLGRAAQGGDPALTPAVPRPVNIGS